MTLALGPRSSLVPENLIPNYQRFLLKNFRDRASELGWAPHQGEIYETRMLRPRLLLDRRGLMVTIRVSSRGKGLWPRNGWTTMARSRLKCCLSSWHGVLFPMAIRHCSTGHLASSGRLRTNRSAGACCMRWARFATGCKCRGRNERIAHGRYSVHRGLAVAV